MSDDEDKDDAIIDTVRKEAADSRKKLRETEAKLKRVEDELPTQLERARADAAAETRAQLQGEHAKAIAGAEVRALAARKLTDPDDAPLFIDMSSVVAADGKVDSSRIERELDELIERKPYLAIASDKPPGEPPPPPPPGSTPPAGSADGGARPPAQQGDAAMDAILRKAIRS